MNEMKVAQACLTLGTPWATHSQWNSPGQNTGVGSLSLHQGIFPTQGSNPGLLHCRQILYPLAPREALGKPRSRGRGMQKDSEARGMGADTQVCPPEMSAGPVVCSSDWAGCGGHRGSQVCDPLCSPWASRCVRLSRSEATWTSSPTQMGPLCAA